MERPLLKLINEAPTRWNSTYQMLSRVASLKEPVWMSLASLKTSMPALTDEEHDIIAEVQVVLAPFNSATVALSEEKRVSGSKTIPMMKMPIFANIGWKKNCQELDKRVLKQL
ncbi:hypothetical protein NQD34_012446 [Periophthalmus magnuspinnatus]|nr:hypothetical protein NQD34_012446 [Periophthalmus magnuspinnatus]